MYPIWISNQTDTKIAIARALSYDSEIILADEPTGNLDPEMEEQIIDLLINLAHKDQKYVIIISHSLNIKKRVDKVFSLARGKLVYDKN